jgi:hypothetical protein
MVRRVRLCINTQLAKLCQHTIELDALTQTVLTFLPSKLQAHCLVSSFEKGILVISTDAPTWATELRYFLPTLRDKLRTEAKLYPLITIKLVLYNHPLQTTSFPTPQKALSSTTCNLLQSAASSLQYEPLKEALLRLGRHTL